MDAPMSTPKMIREALCVAQSALGALTSNSSESRDAGQILDCIAKLGELTAAIDRARPLGPDGVHGDRHTPDCGCRGGPWTLRFPATASTWCALCGEPYRPTHGGHAFMPIQDPKRMREIDLTHTVTEP
jgi:hypothetical protein